MYKLNVTKKYGFISKCLMIGIVCIVISTLTACSSDPDTPLANASSAAPANNATESISDPESKSPAVAAPVPTTASEPKLANAESSISAAVSAPKPTAAPAPKPTTALEPNSTAAPAPEPNSTAAPEPEPVIMPEPEPEQTAAPEPEPVVMHEPEPEPVIVPEPEPVVIPEPEPAAASDGNNSSSHNNFNTYNNPEQQQTSATYVLNKNTKKIHHPNCSSVAKIAPKNYSTSDQSLEVLMSKCYTPCKICFK